MRTSAALFPYLHFRTFIGTCADCRGGIVSDVRDIQEVEWELGMQSH